MLCLWRNGYLSCALRERSRELELQTRLGEWLKEYYNKKGIETISIVLQTRIHLIYN